MSDGPILYDTTLKITAIDPDGKKFDQVSRIVASSSSDGAKVQLDVATNIYPLEAGQTLSFKLASSLDHSAAPNEGTAQEQQEQAKEAWRLDGPSLADEAGYVMYGKIFKYDETSEKTVTAYGSFGGLLLALTADSDLLSKVTIGSQVYLLLK